MLENHIKITIYDIGGAVFTGIFINSHAGTGGLSIACITSVFAQNK